MQKSINMPDRLAEQIEIHAERERRSFTQQVILLLEKAVSDASAVHNGETANASGEGEAGK